VLLLAVMPMATRRVAAAVLASMVSFALLHWLAVMTTIASLVSQVLDYGGDYAPCKGRRHRLLGERVLVIVEVH